MICFRYLNTERKGWPDMGNSNLRIPFMERYLHTYVHRFGLSVFPLREGGKKPPQSYLWRAFSKRLPTQAELADMPSRGGNIAIATGLASKLIVVDFEDRRSALWWWAFISKPKTIAQTRRGYHFYYRRPDCEEKIGNREGVGRKQDGTGKLFDIRGDGGYVVAPPSVVDGHRYEFVLPLQHPSKLTVFDPGWLPEEEPMPAVKNRDDYRKTFTPDRHRLLEIARKYLWQIQAVSGQGGHNTTWRAACHLVRKGLTQSEAYSLLQEWNESNALPPWSERELQHKVTDAFRKEVPVVYP